MLHMRTTLILDEKVVSKAKSMSGIEETTALVREGLKLLIAREASRRLARFPAQPDFEVPKRPRPQADRA